MLMEHVFGTPTDNNNKSNLEARDLRFRDSVIETDNPSAHSQREAVL